MRQSLDIANQQSTAEVPKSSARISAKIRSIAAAFSMAIAAIIPSASTATALTAASCLAAALDAEAATTLTHTALTPITSPVTGVTFGTDSGVSSPMSINYFADKPGDYEFIFNLSPTGGNKFVLNVDAFNSSSVDVENFSVNFSLLITMTVPGGASSSRVRPIAGGISSTIDPGGVTSLSFLPDTMFQFDPLTATEAGIVDMEIAIIYGAVAADGTQVNFDFDGLKSGVNFDGFPTVTSLFTPQVPTVPEPGIAGLFLGGAAMLVGLHRRRK